MREIKFRAWNDDKMFLPVAIGENGKVLSNLWTTDNWVLMQYTGLKDKNGKEIYEGDIVKIYHEVEDLPEESFYSTGVVEFSDGCFWVRGGGHSIIQHFHYNDNEREIIGNIYENGNLIEG